MPKAEGILQTRITLIKEKPGAETRGNPGAIPWLAYAYLPIPHLEIPDFLPKSRKSVPGIFYPQYENVYAEFTEVYHLAADWNDKIESGEEFTTLRAGIGAGFPL